MTGRIVLATIIAAAFAFTAAAQEEPSSDASGFIEVTQMNTYDTGLRLGNGQWSIGSRVHMLYYNALGFVVETEWRKWHFITNRATGDYIVNSTGTSRSYEFASTLTGVGDFSACYQGRAIGTAGGVAREVGGNHVCTDPAPSTGSGGGGCTGETCTGNQQTSGCEYTAEGCPWWYQCPLLVALERMPWRLSDSATGVLFDMDGDGVRERLSWPTTDSALAFVALDINDNGAVDNGSELFGVGSVLPDGNRAPNGFAALAARDSNRDRQIDARDAVWSRLALWRDVNRDGVSQPDELTPLTASGVTSLGLDHHWTGRRDEHGNAFRFQSVAIVGSVPVPYYDVFLRVSP